MINTSTRTVAGLQSLDRPAQSLTAAGFSASAHTQMSAAETQVASDGYVGPLGYSAVPDELGAESGYAELSGYDELSGPAGSEPETKHEPILLVMLVASILAVGAVALAISLAVGIQITGDQLPSSGEAALVPNSQTAVPAAPEVPRPLPIPSGTDIAQDPAPVIQQVPQTVYMTPVQQAPAAVATPPTSPAPSSPEDPEPPMDPEAASQDPEPAPQDPQPAPQDPEPAPQDPEPAPQDPEPADIGQLPGLSHVPEDLRLPVAVTPIIPDLNPPLLSGSEQFNGFR